MGTISDTLTANVTYTVDFNAAATAGVASVGYLVELVAFEDTAAAAREVAVRRGVRSRTCSSSRRKRRPQQ